jgi:Zn-dependent peptidase ImmA (M78 family)
VFPRGFKTSCENVARQQRRNLGLVPSAPLDPYVLAKHLGIIVHSVEDVPGLSPDCLRILLYHDADSWSAVTLSSNNRNVVILNSSHAPTRLASDLVHEIAHILIGHTPSRIDLTEEGLLMLSTYSRQQEDEANWLAGCLLLPRDALVLIRNQRQDLAAAAKKYGISMDMLRYRINVTGVDYQFKRRTNYSM